MRKEEEKRVLWVPPGKITVRLTLPEFFEAQEAVTARMRESFRRGLNHASTMKRDFGTRHEEDLVGASAEVAWATIRGKKWHSPLGEFHHVADDGEQTEVRATRMGNGSLIIRDNDPEDRAYVFATSLDQQNFCFHGWLWGHEARRKEFVKNPHGYRKAWFVPQRSLRLFSEDVVLYEDDFSLKDPKSFKLRKLANST